MKLSAISGQHLVKVKMTKLTVNVLLKKFDNYRGIDVYIANDLLYGTKFIWFLGADICSAYHPQAVMNSIDGYWKMRLN